jgi:60 kDa SS-A/Ro ribonucleoprotein
MKYVNIVRKSKNSTPQSVPLAGQSRNNASGFGWNIDGWELLDRFLILGTEGGTYYVNETKLTLQNVGNVLDRINENGTRVVETLCKVSEQGLAPKNDAAVYALAMAASFGNEETKRLALASINRVCRTGTHLFDFVAACESFRGWGRGLRRAIGNWYNNQNADSLEYGLIKYQSRNGWSHRDLLRLAHPKAITEQHNVLFKWVVDGELVGKAKLIQAMNQIRETKDLNVACSLMKEYRIPRECLLTEMLNEPKIWEALLISMPILAMVRNLGAMTRSGVFRDSFFEGTNQSIQVVLEKLQDAELIRKSRIHPLQILAALTTYQSGAGFKGKAAGWKAHPQIVEALEKALYMSFKNAESIEKRIILGLDVSGSMAGTMVNGLTGLDCRGASAALALLALASEKEAKTLAFDTRVYEINFDEHRSLSEAVKLLQRTGGGGTDCAAVIQYATRHKIKADAFILYTDSETWYGNQHPAQAMEEYRRKMRIDAKLVVVAMASNSTSIARPEDKLTLNVVGLDASVSQVVQYFLRD